MIGIVVVSHSRDLARAAIGMAKRLVEETAPAIVAAAGTDDGELGTEAAAISLAIESADSGDGVLVLVDFGAAIVNCQLAASLIDRELASRLRITSAPIVEGLAAAVVAASRGADLDEVEHEAQRSIEAKMAVIDGRASSTPAPELAMRFAKRRPAITWRTTVRNEHGIHIRPAARIVTELREYDADVQLSNASTGMGPVSAKSLARVSTLQVKRGHILQARIMGPQAVEARDALNELANSNFGEPGDDAQQLSYLNDATPPAPQSDPWCPLPGSDRLCVSGPVHLRTSRPATKGYHSGSPREELRRFTEAGARVASHLAHLKERETLSGETLDAQSTLLTDRDLNHEIVSRITEGFSAIDAVDDSLSDQAHAFDALADSYMRERGHDVRTLRRLLMLAVLGQPLDLDALERPSIWVLEELDALTAVRLDPRRCLGVVTLNGGSFGHGLLSASARGIPVLAGYPGAAGLSDGTNIAFDPVTRQLWVNPNQARLDACERVNQQRRAESAEALAEANDPAVTSHGTRICVQANVGTLDDAIAGANAGAEGFGIVRTELLFASVLKAPSADEQAAAFAKIADILPTGMTTIRLWDAGADKPLPFIRPYEEPNPALGYRGIRLMRDYEKVLVEQLRAILMTARDHDVRILLPMVTEPSEVEWVHWLLDDLHHEIRAPRVPVGVMVEVPAAAIRAADFAGLVDFMSVGTNDLTQYVQAADRTSSAVRPLVRQNAPAVLDLIEMTCRALPDIPVAVCGDVASDPNQVAALLAAGVAELSVRPSIVPRVKRAVRMA